MTSETTNELEQDSGCGDGKSALNGVLASDLSNELSDFEVTQDKAKLFGYKYAACLCCGNHDSNVVCKDCG